MMYQPEIEQQQPTQIGLIKEKIQQTIAQIPRMIEQHGQKRFPVVPETQSKQEQCIEKEYLMKHIKDLVGQVQEMMIGQQECGKTEQEELLRQIREIQTQIQDMMIGEPKTFGIQEKHQQRTTYKNGPREHKQIRETPFELFVECQAPQFGQIDRKMTNELRGQLIEKLIQQVRILEDMLNEKKYDITYQMPKMEQLCFEMERELFCQIKKRFAEVEDQICFSYEPMVEQKLRKLFGLMRQQIQQIEEILYPISGQYTQGKQILKTKEQCFIMLEKIQTFRKLLEDTARMICPEFECETILPTECKPRTYWPYGSKFDNEEIFNKQFLGNKRQEGEQFEITMPNETKSRAYWFGPVAYKFDNEEIFNNKQFLGNKRQEGEQIAMLKRELEAIKMAKHEMEMKLHETNKKVDQFKQQIEMLEQCPKHEQECCARPTQQPKWFPTYDSRYEMLMKQTRGLGEQQQQQHFEKQHPINKLF